jgi:hypothetical protein
MTEAQLQQIIRAVEAAAATIHEAVAPLHQRIDELERKYALAAAAASEALSQEEQAKG